MYQAILNIIQIICAIVLIIVILVQNKGAGLGAAFGGDGSIYRTKRGLEKSLHYITIVVAVLFLVTSFLAVII